MKALLKRIGLLLTLLAAVFIAPQHTAVGSDEPARGIPALGQDLRPIIVLSYPASLSPEAKRAIQPLYMDLNWPQRCGGLYGAIDNCERNKEALATALMKTAFYVGDFKCALETSFPEASVVLQPGMLDLSEDGDLAYRIPNPELPASVRIDFLTHVSTRYLPNKPSHSSTHGLFLAGVMAVKIEHPRYSGTKGLVAVSDGVDLPPIGAKGRQPAVLLHMAARRDARKGESLRGAGFVTIPSKPVKLDEGSWSALVSGSSPCPTQAAFRTYIDSLRSAVAPALRLEPAASEWLPLEQAYQPALTGWGDEREAVLSEISWAEYQFTKQVSDDHAEALRSSDLFASLRESVVAERDYNKKASTLSWMSGLAMTAQGFANLANGVPVGPDGLVAVLAQQQGLRELRAAFDENFDGVQVRQRTVSLRLGNRMLSITASSLQELRSKLREALIEFRTTKLSGDEGAGADDLLS